MSDLSNVLIDRRQLVLDILVIERVYGALAYNGIPYDNFAYTVDRDAVTAKLNELLDIVTKHKLTITMMVLSNALKEIDNRGEIK